MLNLAGVWNIEGLSWQEARRPNVRHGRDLGGRRLNPEGARRLKVFWCDGQSRARSSKMQVLAFTLKEWDRMIDGVLWKNVLKQELSFRMIQWHKLKLLQLCSFGHLWIVQAIVLYPEDRKPNIKIRNSQKKCRVQFQLILKQIQSTYSRFQILRNPGGGVSLHIKSIMSQKTIVYYLFDIISLWFLLQNLYPVGTRTNLLALGDLYYKHLTYERLLESLWCAAKVLLSRFGEYWRCEVEGSARRGGLRYSTYLQHRFKLLI